MPCGQDQGGSGTRHTPPLHVEDPATGATVRGHDRLGEESASEARAEAGTSRQRSYTTDLTCAACSAPFRGKAKQQYCTPLCARQTVILDRIEANRGVSRKSTALAKRTPPRVWLGTHTQGRTWTMGNCAWCGASFICPGATGRYCSNRCGWAEKAHRRYLLRGDFSVTPVRRKRLYERDSWTCQLCHKPVRTDVHYLHALSPTLDHIIPQSLTPAPDHSDSNLRLAHRICNARRGNRLEPHLLTVA